MLLAIDTSTDIASVAILEGDNLLAELTWRCGENHTVELIPNVEYLLKKKVPATKNISCVAVATGPGSYNGLRAGVSAAKSLAFTLGVPIIGITTLEAEAYRYAWSGMPICAVATAGKGEIAFTFFRLQRDKWKALNDIEITTLDDMCTRVTKKTVFCGEFVKTISSQLKNRLKESAIIPSSASLIRRSAFLAEIANIRLNSRDYDDAATLQPVYLRRPQITQSKKSY